ncbi:hypothetical protein [Bordetella ansorpii]|nr:hypothetical protein [Bordetella ansorpii]
MIVIYNYLDKCEKGLRAGRFRKKSRQTVHGGSFLALRHQA